MNGARIAGTVFSGVGAILLILAVTRRRNMVARKAGLRAGLIFTLIGLYLLTYFRT
jgi:hypothetical protein